MAEFVSCLVCGEVTAIPTCKSCGAELVFGSGSQARDSQDQASSERDQTASDQDQTWSDHDQSASDSDQRSADDDQKAADDDFAAGGDARTHSRGAEARDRSTHDRKEISALRDESGAERVDTAEERDRAADPIADPVLRAQGDRARAAADRARAADDRARAAADRELAARERAEAFRSRTESADLLRLATTDELTGAWTRKFGLEQIGRELARTHRTGGTLVLAFIDVDGLKQVNDDRGHLAGDALLQRAGEALQAQLRRYDVIVRYGGDEFVCAMPNLTLSEARKRFEAIAAELTAADPEHSISFGLAEAAHEGALDELIARADGNLLKSRRSGHSEN